MSEHNPNHNDYISFREFLCLTMTNYTVSKNWAEKICDWSADPQVNTHDIYVADTADGKKTSFYNRKDKCVCLTKKEEELEIPKPFDEYAGDDNWIMCFYTKYEDVIWNYYSKEDYWIKHKTDDYFLLIKDVKN